MFMFLNFVLQHIWPLFNVSFLAVVTGGAAATDQYIFTCIAQAKPPAGKNLSHHHTFSLQSSNFWTFNFQTFNTVYCQTFNAQTFNTDQLRQKDLRLWELGHNFAVKPWVNPTTRLLGINSFHKLSFTRCSNSNDKRHSFWHTFWFNAK